MALKRFRFRQVSVLAGIIQWYLFCRDHTAYSVETAATHASIYKFYKKIIKKSLR